jgi:hypothetical protein
MSSRSPERLEPLGLPQSDVGAPLPHILADDLRLVLVYRIADPEPGWDGTTIRIVSGAEDELCAVVIASPCTALRFGPPNDEAIEGHRLAALGIDPYSTYELFNSEWIAELERSNRVHPYHSAEHFSDLRHFVLTFHDSSLEFIASGCTVEVRRGKLRNLLFDAFEGL